MQAVTLFLKQDFSSVLNDSESGCFTFLLDGQHCLTYDDFHDEATIVFQLPDYYGRNPNALDECINDLDWIDAESYALVLRNYDLLFSKEQRFGELPNAQQRKNYLNLFCQAKHDWANVPNHPGEDEYRDRKVFEVFIEKSDEVVMLLDALGIPWELFQKKPDS